MSLLVNIDQYQSGTRTISVIDKRKDSKSTGVTASLVVSDITDNVDFIKDITGSFAGLSFSGSCVKCSFETLKGTRQSSVVTYDLTFSE